MISISLQSHVFFISEFRVNRTESEFRELNRRAMMLKKILSSIPDQIENRQKFLETIK